MNKKLKVFFVSICFVMIFNSNVLADLFNVNTTCLIDEFNNLKPGEAFQLVFNTNPAGEELITWASVAGAICSKYNEKNNLIKPEDMIVIDNIRLTDPNKRKIELCGSIKFNELQQQGCTFKICKKCLAKNIHTPLASKTNKILAQGMKKAFIKKAKK